MNVLPPTSVERKAVGARVAEPPDSGGVAMVIACYVERLLTESEPNLCWPSTSLVLVAPFV